MTIDLGQMRSVFIDPDPGDIVMAVDRRFHSYSDVIFMVIAVSAAGVVAEIVFVPMGPFAVGERVILSHREYRFCEASEMLMALTEGAGND